MFRRHSVDVSEVLHPDGTNLLAILVHPPDHPGRIPIQGGQGGDHEVCGVFLLFGLFPFSLLPEGVSTSSALVWETSQGFSN